MYMLQASSSSQPQPNVERRRTVGSEFAVKFGFSPHRRNTPYTPPSQPQANIAHWTWHRRIHGRQPRLTLELPHVLCTERLISRTRSAHLCHRILGSCQPRQPYRWGTKLVSLLPQSRPLSPAAAASPSRTRYLCTTLAGPLGLQDSTSSPDIKMKIKIKISVKATAINYYYMARSLVTGHWTREGHGYRGLAIWALQSSYSIKSNRIISYLWNARSTVPILIDVDSDSIRFDSILYSTQALTTALQSATPYGKPPSLRICGVSQTIILPGGTVPYTDAASSSLPLLRLRRIATSRTWSSAILMVAIKISRAGSFSNPPKGTQDCCPASPMRSAALATTVKAQHPRRRRPRRVVASSPPLSSELPPPPTLPPPLPPSSYSTSGERSMDAPRQARTGANRDKVVTSILVLTI